MLLNCRYHWIARRNEMPTETKFTRKWTLNTFTDSDNVLKGFDFYFHFNAISHWTSTHQNTMNFCAEYCKQTVELEKCRNPYQFNIVLVFSFFLHTHQIELFTCCCRFSTSHSHCPALPGSLSARTFCVYVFRVRQNDVIFAKQTKKPQVPLEPCWAVDSICIIIFVMRLDARRR